MLDFDKMSMEDMKCMLVETYDFAETTQDLAGYSKEEIAEFLKNQIELNGMPDEGVLDDVNFGDVEVVVDDLPEGDSEDEEEPMNPTNPGWTEYVLSQLTPEEQVNNSPTTDGLRRVAERTLGQIVSSKTEVVDFPRLENERRATVKVSLTIELFPEIVGGGIMEVDGSSDVYWGNTEKPYRNHPVATAETRAEGRALRRALRLTKVLVAEENSTVVDHDYESDDHTTAGTISDAQERFIDQMCKRLNINVLKYIKQVCPYTSTVRGVKFGDFHKVQSQLTDYQRDTDSIPQELVGYEADWRSK